MADDITEMTGYKIVLIKLLKEEIEDKTEILGDTEPIIIRNSTASPGPPPEKRYCEKLGKRIRKHRGDFVPKGVIVRRGRVYFGKE